MQPKQRLPKRNVHIEYIAPVRLRLITTLIAQSVANVMAEKDIQRVELLIMEAVHITFHIVGVAEDLA